MNINAARGEGGGYVSQADASSSSPSQPHKQRGPMRGRTQRQGVQAEGVCAGLVTNGTATLHAQWAGRQAGREQRQRDVTPTWSLSSKVYAVLARPRYPGTAVSLLVSHPPCTQQRRGPAVQPKPISHVNEDHANCGPWLRPSGHPSTISPHSFTPVPSLLISYCFLEDIMPIKLSSGRWALCLEGP